MRSQNFEELLFSFVMSLSVRLSAWNNSSPTGRIFIKFDLEDFFENLARKFKFY